MESESKNIIQMLKNVKTLIEVSKERNCWSLEELKEIDITEHNVSEIVKQLQEREGQTKRFEEIKEDDKKLDESIEQAEEMDEVD